VFGPHALAWHGGPALGPMDSPGTVVRSVVPMSNLARASPSTNGSPDDPAPNGVPGRVLPAEGRTAVHNFGLVLASCGRVDRLPPMESNTHSAGSPEGLTALAAVVEQLAAQDRAGLSDAVRAERVLVLRRLLDRLEGHWLNELADLDAHGAAGADQGTQAGSTASWLRQRLRMAASAATSAVRTARACSVAPDRHRPGPDHRPALPAHAMVLAAGTHHLPARSPPRPNRSRSRRPGGWTTPAPPGPGSSAPGRRPESERDRGQRRHQDRRLRLTHLGGHGGPGRAAGTRGRPDPALGPGTPGPPHSADDTRTSAQRRADALAELARRALEAGQLPQSGGSGPS
jgi:Domain of unknown function (DUF222)